MTMVSLVEGVQSAFLSYFGFFGCLLIPVQLLLLLMSLGLAISVSLISKVCTAAGPHTIFETGAQSTAVT